MISNIKKCSNEESNLSTASSKRKEKGKDISLSSISGVRKTHQQLLNEKHEVVAPLKKQTANEFIQKLQFLVNYFHDQGKISFHNQASKFLQKGWTQFRIKLTDRLNKIIYLEPTLKYKSFLEIEQHIIREWRKNPILFAMNHYWFDSMMKYKFENPQEFQAEFQAQKNFIAQTIYMMCKPFFVTLQKNNVQVLDILTLETSCKILTSLQEWDKLYKFVVKSVYIKDQSSNGDQVNYQFDLTSLQTKKYAIDFQEKQIYPRTINAINNFIQQTNLDLKLSALKKYRNTMEDEIREHQSKMLFEGKIEKIDYLQKDDIIDILVACIIKGEIKGLKMGLRYFPIILGQTYNIILTEKKVDMYRADLQSALQFLEQHTLQTSLVRIPKRQTRSENQGMLQSFNTSNFAVSQKNLMQYSQP